MVNADELEHPFDGVEMARVEPDPRRPALAQSSDNVKVETAPINPLAAINLEQLGHTIERPLFTPTRQPPPIIKKKKRVAYKQPKKKPDTRAFSLVGVVLGPGISVALLREKATGTILSLYAGDTAKGWRVQKIGPTNVTLLQDETTVSLRLFPR